VEKAPARGNYRRRGKLRVFALRRSGRDDPSRGILERLLDRGNEYPRALVLPPILKRSESSQAGAILRCSRAKAPCVRSWKPCALPRLFFFETPRSRRADRQIPPQECRDPGSSPEVMLCIWPVGVSPSWQDRSSARRHLSPRRIRTGNLSPRTRAAFHRCRKKIDKGRRRSCYGSSRHFSPPTAENHMHSAPAAASAEPSGQEFNTRSILTQVQAINVSQRARPYLLRGGASDT
jgi:hypothetical protein